MSSHFESIHTSETNHLLGDETETINNYSTNIEPDINPLSLPIPCHRLKNYLDAKNDLEEERIKLVKTLSHNGIKHADYVLDRVKDVQCQRPRTVNRPSVIKTEKRVDWRSLFLMVVCIIGSLIVMYRLTEQICFHD